MRILVDALGSFSTSNRFWNYLRRAGAEVRLYAKPRPVDLLANLSRDHRKLVVVDGTVAFTGGFCIGDEWLGDPAKGRLPWRETGVSVAGPAAASLDRAFSEIWSASGGALPADELAGDVNAVGTTRVRVAAGVPGRDRVFRTMDLLLSGATDRFWVTDAYFMAPRRLYQSLLDASREGLDIRLLVPGTSDLPFVRNLTRFGYRKLLRGGVRIFEWNGPMLHAKTMVADNRWSRIGSSNLNPSSLFGNWELDVLIDDPEFADRMEAQFRRDLEQASEVRLRPTLGARSIGPGRPTALEIPDVDSMEHRPSYRERRRRSLLALRTLVGSARLATFGPLAVAFVAVGVLFLVLPRIMALAFAVLALWVGVAAAFHALRSGEPS